jgi:hypothetical protein
VHTRRISTFLIGAWIAGCLLMSFVVVQSPRNPTLVLTSPVPPVAKAMQQLGWDQMSALLRHAASEQTRHLLAVWIDAQIPLSLLVLGCLALATQKRLTPLALCGMMLIVVLFQLRIVPELTYQGRATDFAPGSEDVTAVTRYWALQQVFVASEVIKLLCGGVLASYLFIFRTHRRDAAEKRPAALTRATR